MTSSGSAQPGEFGLQPPGVVRLGETGVSKGPQEDVPDGQIDRDDG
jgi:hypothetical protein